MAPMRAAIDIGPPRWRMSSARAGRGDGERTDMGRLIYLTPTSLDGFIGDGDYSWSAPYAEEIMAALTVGLAEVGTYIYVRRTYETMAVWETEPAVAEQSPESAGFAAMWQAADKVVISSTLAQVHTRRTRLERGLL